MKRWEGKVAVVTGASAGIGSAIAEKLAQAGVIVVGLARRVERIEAQAKLLSSKADCKGKLYAIKCDLTKEEDILHAFQWTKDNVGIVHILINNAAINPGTNLIDGITEQWRLCFDTNVIALLIATREATQMMRKHNIDGHIININSIMGHVEFYLPTFNVYPATKHAVKNISFYLRQELAACGTNIKVTSVSPGLVDTEFFTDANMPPGEMEKLHCLPFLHKNDIADTIMYVLSTPPDVHIGELMVRPKTCPC